MIINKFPKLATGLIMAAMLSFNYSYVVLVALAAAQPTAPICDPWPEDTNKILECINWYNENSDGRDYGPAEDPAKPVEFPTDGIAGIASAYDSKTDSVLVVAGKFVSDTKREIWGMMADAKTLAPKSAPFRVDSSGANSSTGTPKVVYSPELEKFLVAWEDVRPCGQSCRSEYGRFISAQGAPIGLDFPIYQGAAFLNDLTYDSNNKKFVVLYEPSGSFVGFKTVDGTGTVSNQVVVSSSYPYQGQAGIAYNSNSDEYWVDYVVTLSGGDTANEDDRIMFSRVDAKTLKVIGKPVQLSQTRIGRNAVSAAHIAYSKSGGGAVAIWQEGGRIGIAGTWGRTVYDDGSLSDEYQVITADSNPYSDGFASSSVSYNPWADSFFVPSGDWDGNAWITELDLTGMVYWTQPALFVSSVAEGNWWSKLLAIKTAFAKAVGSFNINSAMTPYGSATFASRNYAGVVGTVYNSPNAIPPTDPPPSYPTKEPEKLNFGPISVEVNQIYIWSIGIAALLALFMIVYGGIMTLTSAGNADRASRGRKYIFSSLIGLVLLFGAYLLLNTINPDLVNFKADTTTQSK